VKEIRTLANGLECGDRSHRFHSRQPRLALHGVKAATAVAALQTVGARVAMLSKASQDDAFFRLNFPVASSAGNKVIDARQLRAMPTTEA
jgi:hypothetical protein